MLLLSWLGTALLLFAATVNAQVWFTTQTGSQTNGVATIAWAFDATYETITFDLSVLNYAWIGIGFSTTNTMAGADFAIAFYNSSGVFISDRTARAGNGHGEPDLDISKTEPVGTDDLYDKSGETVTTADGILLKAHFSRKCTTNDVYDVPCRLATGFLFAYGPLSNTGAIARHTERTATGQPVYQWLRTYAAEGNTWSARWAFDDAIKTATFEVTALGDVWVGLGISTSGIMAGGSDFIIGAKSSTGFSVEDRTAGDGATWHGLPPRDVDRGGRDDLVNASLISVTDTDGTTKTILKFSRAVITGDVYDQEIINGTSFLLMASGPVQDASIRIHSFRLASSVNFIGDLAVVVLPPPEVTTNFVEAHGIIMTLTWTLIVVPATFLARHFKLLVPTWFFIHRAANIVAALLLLSAAILIFYESDFILTTEYTHSLLGVAVLSITLVQIILGFISHWMWKPGQQTPWWPDKIHWWLGRSVVVLALLTTFYGIDLYSAIRSGKDPLIPFILLGAYIFVSILFAVYLEWTLGAKSESVEADYQPLNNGSVNIIAPRSLGFVTVGYAVTSLGLVGATLALLLAPNEQQK